MNERTRVGLSRSATLIVHFLLVLFKYVTMYSVDQHAFVRFFPCKTILVSVILPVLHASKTRMFSPLNIHQLKGHRFTVS